MQTREEFCSFGGIVIIECPPPLHEKVFTCLPSRISKDSLKDSFIVYLKYREFNQQKGTKGYLYLTEGDLDNPEVQVWVESP